MSFSKPFYQIFIGLFWLLLLTKPSEAQTLNFERVTVNDGLLSSTVYFTFQDSRGFIWFATESGVNRYDGTTFESFSLEDGLTDNEVLGIQEDSEHRIWFFTLNGQLCYYFNNKFHNPGNNDLLKKASPKASVVYFFEDSRKRIWLCTNQQEIVLIDNNSVLFYKFPPKYFLANSFITEDKAGRIWILNQKSAFRVVGRRLIPKSLSAYPASQKSFITDRATGRALYISKTGLVEFTNGQARLLRPIDPLVISQGLSHFLIDGDESIWLGTMGNGIYRFFPGGKSSKFLPSRFISHLLRDRSGNIWISTIGDGVYRLSEFTKNYLQYNESSGLKDASVHSLIKDEKGVIWLGLRNGWVNLLNGSSVIARDLRLTRNNYNPIKSLAVDTTNHSVWFATNNSLGEIKQDLSGVRYLTEQAAGTFAMKSFSLSRDGQLAFALASGVYVLPDKNNALRFTPTANIPGIQKFFPLRAYTTFFDSRNSLWFSNMKGLFRYSKEILTDFSSLSPLLAKRITDIRELADGTMALATYGHGVILLKDSTITHHITAKKGLTSDIVIRLEPHDKHLWAVTNKGVSKILLDHQKFPIDTYQTQNGLLSNEANDIYVKGSDVYVATNSGLSILKDIKQSTDTTPPPLYLTKLRIGSKTVSATGELDLKHDENSISVNFTAINFNPSKKISYRYRLKPEDSYVTIHNSSVDFASLEPGEYKLEIQARNQFSRWSDPILLNFVIHPPFWKTPGFIIVSALVLAALALQGIRFYLKTQRRHEEEDLLVQNKIIALEQQALQAMMNPHFVFNVMNSIQHFINTRNDLAANKVLTGFARLIRTNMEVCTKSYITLEEEVEYLKLYLALEALRFGERMTYDIEVDPGIDAEEVFLPSMLLQPFVENAIWHGIMPKEDGGRIKVSFNKPSEDSIRIDIVDDGIGILNGQKNKDTSHVSRGMQLTSDRIKLLNKSLRNPIVLDISQTGSFGTRVTFLIPLS